MKNEITKLENSEVEITSLDEMIAGCDSAVVTYGVDKDYNVHKVVTIFQRSSRDVYQFEEFGASHTKTLGMNPQMTLVKGFDFKVEGKRVRNLGRGYFKQLLRTLIGFVKDDTTQDLRDIYEYGKYGK